MNYESTSTIMRTYILTSSKFSGQVTFNFDLSGYLISFNMEEAQLNEAQKVYMLQRMPRHYTQIKQILGKSKDAKLTLQVATSISFGQFWDRYNEKTRSSKKKAQTVWNRFSQAKRDRAYNYIDTYERNIPSGISKKYAETYLNSEIWEN